MNSSEKNKLLSENAIISTVHFQKRMEKLFNYFKIPEAFKPFVMRDYFIRVEFQARGAPHVHCLLWLKEEVIDEHSGIVDWKPLQTMFFENEDKTIENEKIRNIERYAEKLITASLSDVKCTSCKEEDLRNKENIINTNIACEECELIKTRASTFNTYICGFSCFKEKKALQLKQKKDMEDLTIK